MNPEAQRIAIAEACGWKSPKHPEVIEAIKDWPHSRDRGIWWMKPNSKEFAWLTDVPDYLNDLNACHEMEKVLDGSQILSYLVLLQPNWFPTAAQRCEAFLITLGLWK